MKQEGNMTIQRVFWKIAGANIEILSKSPTDWQKFTMLGALILISSILGTVTMTVAVGTVSNNYLTIFASGIFWGILILSINRSIALSIISTTSTISRIISSVLRILLSVIISLTISVPFTLIIFDGLISQKAQSLDFYGKMIAFQEIMNEDITVQIMYYLIIIVMLLIELCPLVLLWTMQEGAYEKIMQEDKYVEIEEAHLRNKEKLEKAVAQSQKREDLKRMPFGGFELYIDYKRLQVNDVNILLGSLNGLYNVIYKIQSSNNHNFINEDIFKSYPEDTFLIHSIETGNSITIKVTTGWKPKLEVIEGDFVISLPKGAVALLLTGYLITKIFNYGISNYKEILEIEKLRIENKILEKEWQSFDAKLEETDPHLRETFHYEILNFYNLTISNTNYNQLKLIQDTAITKKMDKGELIIK
jgi:nitrogen fixation-related uncharacterized protein